MIMDNGWCASLQQGNGYSFWTYSNVFLLYSLQNTAFFYSIFCNTYHKSKSNPNSHMYAMYYSWGGCVRGGNLRGGLFRIRQQLYLSSLKTLSFQSLSSICYKYWLGFSQSCWLCKNETTTTLCILFPYSCFVNIQL